MDVLGKGIEGSFLFFFWNLGYQSVLELSAGGSGMSIYGCLY